MFFAPFRQPYVRQDAHLVYKSCEASGAWSHLPPSKRAKERPKEKQESYALNTGALIAKSAIAKRSVAVLSHDSPPQAGWKRRNALLPRDEGQSKSLRLCVCLCVCLCLSVPAGGHNCQQKYTVVKRTVVMATHFRRQCPPPTVCC